jgi:hypothetical protein
MKQQVILSFLFLALFQGTMSASEDYYKEFRKSIAVPANVTLDLQVNFADVNITTWNQPTMEIFVKMDLNVKSQERADAISNAISVIENADWIRLSIDIPNEKSWGIVKSESMNIVAEIKMPATGNISGNLGFGDLVLNELQGVCKLKTNYGDVNAKALTNPANSLQHDFGDLVVTTFGGGKINTSYGDTRIGELLYQTDFHFDFGDLKIEKTNANCNRLDIKGSYGDVLVGIGTETGANFNLNTDYGDIKVDAKAKKSLVRTDFSSQIIQGNMGSGKCELAITNKFGDIKVVSAD